MIEEAERRQGWTLFATPHGVRRANALAVTRWVTLSLPRLPLECPRVLDCGPTSTAKPPRPLPFQQGPFDGSCLRSTANGKSVQGGAKSYIRNARMMGGFAILAYPADYRPSEAMTSVVHHHREVGQRDSDCRLSEIARVMSRADGTWQGARLCAKLSLDVREHRPGAKNGQGSTRTSKTDSTRAGAFAITLRPSWDHSGPPVG